MPIMRILLVDDEQELTNPLSHLLQQEGYQIDVAADGHQGASLAIEHVYDL
jgi:two-component system, OmpR family, manganese sensing response regulator